MVISGFIPVSFVDFPKTICSTVFLGGCNFRCSYCHNRKLINPHTFIEEDRVLEELSLIRGKKIDGVCISGGEPTIHYDLLPFIKKISDLSLKIKLDTNGSNPKLLKEILDSGLVSYIAMDIKCAPQNYHRLCDIQNIEELILTSIQLIKESGIDHEFRTTVVPSIVKGEDSAIIGELSGDSPWFLQRYT